MELSLEDLVLTNIVKATTIHSSESTAGVSNGRCYWDSCPGLKKSEVSGAKTKKSRSTKTTMYCERCTDVGGNKTIFLCNGSKCGVIANCHQIYHAKYHKKQYYGKI